MEWRRIALHMPAALLMVGCASILPNARQGGRDTWMPIPGPARIAVGKYTGPPPIDAEAIERGRRIYDRSCRYCHGAKGNGGGAVTFFLTRDRGPHPRDFTSGVFKFRSTPTGELPTDEDLFRSITNGIPGFMPPFTGLDPAERWRLVYYVKTLSPDFATDGEPELIEVVGAAIPTTAGSVRRGFEVYQELKCWECHGAGGRGDGPKAPDQVDDMELSLPPTDLTRPSSFKAGAGREHLYRTIMTGLDGSSMPSYGDMLAGQEEDIWHLANYILSLSQERR